MPQQAPLIGREGRKHTSLHKEGLVIVWRWQSWKLGLSSGKIAGLHISFYQNLSLPHWHSMCIGNGSYRLGSVLSTSPWLWSLDDIDCEGIGHFPLSWWVLMKKQRWDWLFRDNKGLGFPDLPLPKESCCQSQQARSVERGGGEFCAQCLLLVGICYRYQRLVGRKKKHKNKNKKQKTQKHIVSSLKGIHIIIHTVFHWVGLDVAVRFMDCSCFLSRLRIRLKFIEQSLAWQLFCLPFADNLTAWKQRR